VPLHRARRARPQPERALHALSPHHLHRLFKRVTGLTPRAYATAARACRLRDALPKSASVTAAIYASGYGSSGRFYTQARRTLGMKPAEFRRGGAGQTLRYAVARCSLGRVLVAASEAGLCAILLGDAAAPLVDDLKARFPRATFERADRGFERTLARVVALVEAPYGNLGLPLDVRGTAFQERVWRALQAVPAGATVTYSELAERIGSPRAVRAVASACARNPLAVVVPCHRVVQ
jgi:AraC family transcriptional regulator of adaptative response/methylated-DNA-[protein]-cysteine methyltransferase